MTDKQQIVSQARTEFQRWESLLARLSEAQLLARQLPSQLSVKDVVAHLYAWQQRSIARLEAATLDQAPRFPEWPAGLDPEDEDVDQINGWIDATHRDEPWPVVYRNWRAGFARFLTLTEAIPEEALLAPGRFPWLGESPLSLIVLGSCEHHEEHLEELEAWLRQSRSTQ